MNVDLLKFITSILKIECKDSDQANKIFEEVKKYCTFSIYYSFTILKHTFIIIIIFLFSVI